VPQDHRRTKATVLCLGAVLALMNSAFYLAIDRLPLGTVAAIEFLPVIVLAPIAVRSRRNVLAVVLAVGGVYLVTDLRFAGQPIGLLFAALNAILFAGYIILGHRVASSNHIKGIDGLRLSMLIAAVVALPIGITEALPAFGDPVALAAGVRVGVCSSVIPYVFDQLAMARLTRGSYALMVSLLPATATIIGVVVLTQIPSFAEIAGVLLVILGVAVHQERRGPDDAQSATGANRRPVRR